MKHFLIMALLCLCFSALKAQLPTLGKSREYVRKFEKENGVVFVKDAIADTGEQFDMFEADNTHLITFAFYYDLNYICKRYKVIISRDLVPTFIERAIGDTFDRVNNFYFISKDGQYHAYMTLNSDNTAEFDFAKKAK